MDEVWVSSLSTDYDEQSPTKPRKDKRAHKTGSIKSKQKSSKWFSTKMEVLYSYFSNGSELPADCYMFGRTYQSKKPDQKEIEMADKDQLDGENFVKDLKQLFWFSYRKDFPPIAPATLTSDASWGCMLRCGQMLLFQTLATHYFGRGWLHEKEREDELNTLLKKFLDGPEHSYSIHKIAQIGTQFGKSVGEWFGPSTMSTVLGELMELYPVDNFCVYVSTDGALYLDEIVELCSATKGTPDGDVWRSLFILVPVRLGLDSINNVYFDPLKQCFQMHQSVGIIGGKPRSAFYFVGCQDSKTDTNLYYLDPHIVQSSVSIKNSSFPTESYHSSSMLKMPMKGIDPSMALGFYCKDKLDFVNFWKVSKGLAQVHQHFLYCVEEQAPEYRKQKKRLSIDTFELLL